MLSKWEPQSAEEFGFFAGFVCAIFQLCFRSNILIITNFNILKYTKKIFKISVQRIFNVQQRTTQRKNSREYELSVELWNLNLYTLFVFCCHFLFFFFSLFVVLTLMQEWSIIEGDLDFAIKTNFSTFWLIPSTWGCDDERYDSNTNSYHHAYTIIPFSPHKHKYLINHFLTNV